jgi:hypothetical protein
MVLSLVSNLLSTFFGVYLDQEVEDILQGCEHMTLEHEYTSSNALYHGNSEICADCNKNISTYFSVHSFDRNENGILHGTVGDCCEDCGYTLKNDDLDLCSCSNPQVQKVYVEIGMFNHYLIQVCDICKHCISEPQLFNHDYERVLDTHDHKIDKCKNCGFTFSFQLGE